MDTVSQAKPSTNNQLSPQYPPGLRPFAWPKGVSGNPSGRSKGVASLARELTHNGRDCLEYLVSVLMNDRERTRFRIDAAVELLNRAYGKAIQSVDISGELDMPLRIVIERPLPAETITADVHVIEAPRDGGDRKNE